MKILSPRQLLSFETQKAVPIFLNFVGENISELLEKNHQTFHFHTVYVIRS